MDTGIQGGVECSERRRRPDGMNLFNLLSNQRFIFDAI
jgi:hypothetical protein